MNIQDKWRIYTIYRRALKHGDIIVVSGSYVCWRERDTELCPKCNKYRTLSTSKNMCVECEFGSVNEVLGS